MAYITEGSSFEKRIQNWKNASDAAFLKMAKDIREENGGNINYVLVNDGAYEVVKC